MTFWVKRIILKDGELITEKELTIEVSRYEEEAPVVGDIILVSARGRSFRAEVVWGNWPHPERNLEQSVIVPIRVKEL